MLFLKFLGVKTIGRDEISQDYMDIDLSGIDE